MCAEFPDPEPLPGHDLLKLVGAGLHQVVRSLATGRHYGSSHAYPLVPGVDAVARTADGRLVYTGWPRAPWGTVAERLSYVQIGAVAGSDAAVPATLLRSRRIRISGSGAGSVSTERMIAELPKVAALIADGTLDAPYTAYPLDRIGDAWAHAGRDRAVVTPR